MANIPLVTADDVDAWMIELRGEVGAADAVKAARVLAEDADALAKVFTGDNRTKFQERARLLREAADAVAKPHGASRRPGG